MTMAADTGFAEMRLGKVVGFLETQDHPSFYVVLDGVSQDRHLPIQIGQMEAFNLSAALTGVEFARPMGPQFAAGLLGPWRAGPPASHRPAGASVRRRDSLRCHRRGRGPGRCRADRRPAEQRAEPARAGARAHLRGPEVLADAEARQGPLDR